MVILVGWSVSQCCRSQSSTGFAALPLHITNMECRYSWHIYSFQGYVPLNICVLWAAGILSPSVIALVFHVLQEYSFHVMNFGLQVIAAN